jgi:hypothetical protein
MALDFDPSKLIDYPLGRLVPRTHQRTIFGKRPVPCVSHRVHATKQVESLPKYQIAAFWRCTTMQSCQSIGLANALSCSDHVLLPARVRGFCGVEAEAGRECASLGGIAGRVVVVPEAAHRTPLTVVQRFCIRIALPQPRCMRSGP